MKYLISTFLLLPFLALAQVEDNFEKANIAFEQSQFDTAYIHLKNSLGEDPDHLPSKIMMGKVMALSFLYDEAVLEFYEALERGADPNLVMEFLANSLLVENRYQDLIVLEEKGLTAKNKAVLLAVQAKAYNELDDAESAHRNFASAILLSPSNAAVLDAYAKFELEQRNLAAAKKLAKQAIEADPSYTESYRTLAAIYRNLDDLDAYIKALNTALAIEPEQPLVLRDLVNAYVSLNQFQSAEETINKILVNSPQDPMAKFMLSYVQSQNGNTDEAQATLEELVNYLSLLDADSLEKGDGLLYISGIANYAAGNINAAMQDLQSYLIKQPNDIQASLILSDIYASEGSFATAISVLERFSQKAETDLQFGSKLCRLYLQANLNHKCNQLTGKLAEQFSTDPKFIALKARVLAARGRENEALATLQTITETSDSLIIDKVLLSIQTSQYAEAEKQVNVLLTNNPNSNDFKNLLASIYIKQGNIQGAKNILEEVLTQNPEHFSARFNLSSVYANLGDLEEAKSILSQLLEERPQQTDVLAMLAKIENLLGNYEEALAHIKVALIFAPNSADLQMESASIYSNMGEVDEAIEIASQLVRDNFLVPEFLLYRADLYIRVENYYGAKNDLATLYGIYSDNFSALYNLALSQERANDLDGAWKSIQRSLTLNPDNYATQLESLRLAILSNRLDEAKTQSASLNRRYKNQPDLLMLNGDLAQAEDKLSEAAEFYQQAINADNTFAQALLKRYLLANQGFAPEAFVKLVESSIESGPSSDLKRHLVGDLYLDNKNYTKAKEHYRQIIKNNVYPRLPFVLNNYANIYIQEASFESAYEHALKAYQLLPSNPFILDTLGWSLSQLGKYDEGLKYLRQSFAMNTIDPAVRYHLGYTLFKLNRKTEAKREIESLLEQFDDFKYRQNALALMAEMNRNS
ncbi:XrtA/PEP-CTERM system TPR-repeat protein PrsT [Glaciecola sp. SC05]|uniref:XrtA/PEP-CTERM system TPR-repeat protein PrsT n=1 Tax=Glaciecola sp. SC05 TaxID=1987355 RepID=UPI0035283EBF